MSPGGCLSLVNHPPAQTVTVMPLFCKLSSNNQTIKQAIRYSRNMMNKKIKLLIPLLVCTTMLTACDNKPAENTSAALPKVGVVTITPGTVSVTSELPGRTVPFEIAEIRPQVGGIIVKRNFIEGDKVKQGDSLYQIDPAPLKAALDSAKGNLA